MIVNLDVATYGTCVGGITAVYTIGSGYFGAVGVTKSRYLIISVSIVTCGASIGGVACSGTSRSSYYCTVVVTGCCDLLSICVRSIVLTGIGHYTLLCTGRSESFNTYVIVSKRLSRVSNIAVTTCGTSVGGVACSLTGRSGYFGIVGVTKSCYLIISVSIVTCGASIGGVTAVYTIRCGYYCIVAMTCSGQYSMST